MNEIVINLCENNIIDEDMLYRTTGIIRTKTGNFSKATGSKAKYFSNMNCGYIYPLWKTHKMSPEKLKECAINDIPVRIVQAAGNTYLSRITAMLNSLLDPVSKQYCQFRLNEYCKDSSNYLEDLKAWKLANKDTNCIVNTVDVVNLYPSLEITLIENAIEEALTLCTNYNNSMIKGIIKLCKMAIYNNFIQFRECYFKQKKGIITGDNNSVAIANIALHFIMLKVRDTNKVFLIKRFIDDIVFISENKETAKEVIKNLKDTFEKHNLKITSSIMSEDNTTVPFLDVEHVLNNDSEIKSFKTKNFIKETAKNATFLNGRSYHPLNVFKGIITGEIKRLKRLNEDEKDFKESLLKLEKKCISSNFNPKIVKSQFERINEFISNESSNKLEKQKAKNIYWSSQFKTLLRFTKEEKKLFPIAKTSFTKPSSIGQLLNTFSCIAKKGNDTHPNNKSKKCKNCALCGKYNYKDMIDENSYIKTNENRIVNIKPKLNCKNYGIYSAQCTICKEIYVGQTKNSFNLRWNAHRNNWKKFQRNSKLVGKGDESALFKHYFENHHGIIENMGLDSAYKIMFLEQPEFKNLDYKESLWIKSLNAKINLNKTFYEDLII